MEWVGSVRVKLLYAHCGSLRRSVSPPSAVAAVC